MTTSKKWKKSSERMKNGRRPFKKLEDDLKKNGRGPQAQLKKSTLIGCNIIVNYFHLVQITCSIGHPVARSLVLRTTTSFEADRLIVQLKLYKLIFPHGFFLTYSTSIFISSSNLGSTSTERKLYLISERDFDKEPGNLIPKKSPLPPTYFIAKLRPSWLA